MCKYTIQVEVNNNYCLSTQRSKCYESIYYFVVAFFLFVFMKKKFFNLVNRRTTTISYNCYAFLKLCYQLTQKETNCRYKKLEQVLAECKAISYFFHYNCSWLWLRIKQINVICNAFLHPDSNVGGLLVVNPKHSHIFPIYHMQ